MLCAECFLLSPVLLGLVHSWPLAGSISDIAAFQIPSSQRNQVQGLDDSQGMTAIKTVASCVLQCWMEIRCSGRYQSAVTDCLHLVSAVIAGDPAALQAVRWNYGAASLNTKVIVQIWEIPDISPGERNGTSGYWCSSWDLNTLTFTLKTTFLRLFSSLRHWELFVKRFLLPLELFLPFLPPVEVQFPPMKQCSNTSVGEEGIYAFLDAPGMPYTHGICQSHCCCLWCSWELSWPCLQVDRADTTVRI